MPRKKERMILISVHIPIQMLDDLDNLVAQGLFPSRSEAIRIAIRDMLYKEQAKTKEEGELMVGR
jgi:Arc/MetJ-type ribon-helix-helix transcriptional regulator